MLRSFDYASRSGLPEKASPQAVSFAEAWKSSTRAAFLQGYFGVQGIEALWPSGSEDRQALLDLFEAEKAFYELRYELRHRPDWLAIPLAGLLSLV